MKIDESNMFDMEKQAEYERNHAEEIILIFSCMRQVHESNCCPLNKLWFLEEQ